MLLSAFVYKDINRGFPTRMVYLYYIICLRYTILVESPRSSDTEQISALGFQNHLNMVKIFSNWSKFQPKWTTDCFVINSLVSTLWIVPFHFNQAIWPGHIYTSNWSLVTKRSKFYIMVYIHNTYLIWWQQYLLNLVVTIPSYSSGNNTYLMWLQRYLPDLVATIYTWFGRSNIYLIWWQQYLLI